MTLLRAAAMGRLTSCVIEAVSCSIVTTRFACASLATYYVRAGGERLAAL